MVPLTGSYYTSYYSNSSTEVIPNKNASSPTVSTSTQNRITVADNSSTYGIQKFIPSAKPNMLISGQNLVPVKTLIKAKSVGETMNWLAEVGWLFIFEFIQQCFKFSD